MLQHSSLDLGRVMDNVRIWAMIAPEPNTGCWLWAGTLSPSGYGRRAIGRYKTVQAHRLVYELAGGEIPDGSHIDHLCRVTSCVNPLHLEPVTPQENWRRGGEATKRRITHCARGHAYADGLWRAEGPRRRRACLRCIKIRAASKRRAFLDAHPAVEERLAHGE